MDNKMQLGVTESKDTSNRVYLNLRTGKLSETSKEPKEGYKEFTTENASGTKYKFYAKTYDELTVFIKNIEWHSFDYEGKKIISWNLTLDAGDGKEYILQINSGDRPFQTIMTLLPNVDFYQPLRIVAFMGKDQKTGKNQKVLLFTQNPDKTAKDWIKPAFQQKWLSTLLADKVKQGVPLTDEEKANLAWTDDGKPDNTFPYIRQKKDGTWSLDAWTDFLIENMESTVIPNVQEATERRDFESSTFASGLVRQDDNMDEPFEYSGSIDDDSETIPF